MYVLLLMVFLVPVAFVIEGTVAPALFIDRYLVPVNAAVALLITEAVTWIDPRTLLPPWLWKPALAVGITGYAAVLANYDFKYIGQFVVQHQDYTEALTANLPKGVPVVCQDAFSFSELIAREHDSGVLYTYLLDWENATAPRTPRLEVTLYHLMENWKKVGYFSGSIEYREPFLAAHPYFLVLGTEEVRPASVLAPAQATHRESRVGDPVPQRLARDGRYQVKLYQVVPAGLLEEHVWLVCRKEVAPCDARLLAEPRP